MWPQRHSSLVVASVHKSSSARSACTFRQTAKMPSPTKASSSSFFTVRTLHIACESLNQALRTPCSLARGLSPGPGNASLVPDGAVRLIDVTVPPEDQEPVERLGEPA